MLDDRTKLELRIGTVGPWPVNAYALVCPASRQSVLVDPGAEPDKLLDLLAGTQPAGVLVTHSHPDHVGALEEMRARLGAPVMAHPGPHYEGRPLEVDRWLVHGDVVPVGRHALKVYHTPGHIDDALCFALEGDERVIVGDAIFEGGPGHTESSADLATTLQTLRAVILAWPDDTVCYPGHGPHFRLGDKRVAIEAFLNRDHGDLCGDVTWEM